MAQFWYHESIRSTTVAFMKFFNDIRYRRDLTDGTLGTEKVIPISFDSKNKMIGWMLFHAQKSKLATVLPRLSVQLTGMAHDPSRKMQPFNRVLAQTATPGDVTMTFVPAPYNFDYTLTLWTKYQTDGLQVLEQIASNFNPTLHGSITEIPALGIKRDVPIRLNNIGMDVTGELGEIDERVLTYTFDFTLNGSIYAPISDGKTIETIRAITHDYLAKGDRPEDSLMTITDGNIDVTDTDLA